MHCEVGAAPHTWRNNSDGSNKRDKIAKAFWKTMRQQASGTQRCTESEGHIETCQYTMKTEGPFKKLRNLCTISIWNDRCFLRNLCTACSGTHSLIPHTYTAMYVYTYTAAHIPAQLCTYILTYTYWRLCVNVYECIRACTPVHGSTTPTCSMVVWDVILGHVGGLASESSAYTCMAFHTTLQL